MSDVNETLQGLMERRLRELGHRRGRGESISLREAHERLLETINERNAKHAENGTGPEPSPPTYEVFRRIRNGHTTISPATARALATMLDVPLADVHHAMGQRAPLGPFELPDRAHQLRPEEREVVLSVIDAILKASSATEPRPAATRLRAVPQPTADLEAARDTGMPTKRQRREAVERDPNVDDPGPEHGA